MIDFHTLDILIVGAGPAGSAAAAAAAKEGAATLLIDAKPRIGGQPHCGEFVPSRLFQEFQLSADCIIQDVERMETYVSDSLFAEIGTKTETVSPGYMIDRARFDRDLAREAAFQGATVLCSTRLIRREDDHWILMYNGDEVTIIPRYVIAADGALSTVASALHMERPDILTGIQIEAPLVASQNNTFVFLEKSIVGGYGWLFPKRNVANVGMGMVTNTDTHPRRVFDAFAESLVGTGMIRRGRLARSGGVIPVSGPRRPLVSGNVIFCGDAAGLTHPITGAGIPQALFSGYLAGSSAAAALKTGNPQHLKDYDSEITGRYHGVLEHALAKRKLMMTRWNDPDFQDTCEQTWIAFKKYRKRVR
jgi:digeranylgeranylglycerophospholipid reductase